MNDSDIRDWLAEEARRWDDAAADAYDTPGEGMFDPGLLAATVSLLKELAAGGPALELGVGTGRVAIPLMDSGVPVHGVDLSPAMLRRLREKVAEARLPVTLGDMSSLRVPGAFSLVYLVFNTLSNLLSREAQLACFNNAARHLAPGGHFVVELWIPRLDLFPPDTRAMVTQAAPGYFCVDTVDTSRQQVISHHIRFGEGREASIFRSRHRYIWPQEMDLMARAAGLALEARYQDWHRTPFGEGAANQIAVYQKI